MKSIRRCFLTEKIISIQHHEKTLLDFNRCGVPLIEIVSEADIHTREEAILYVEKLREILF